MKKIKTQKQRKRENNRDKREESEFYKISENGEESKFNIIQKYLLMNFCGDTS